MNWLGPGNGKQSSLRRLPPSNPRERRPALSAPTQRQGGPSGSLPLLSQKGVPGTTSEKPDNPSSTGSGWRPSPTGPPLPVTGVESICTAAGGSLGPAPSASCVDHLRVRSCPPPSCRACPLRPREPLVRPLETFLIPPRGPLSVPTPSGTPSAGTAAASARLWVKPRSVLPAMGDPRLIGTLHI